ncbi:MAG: M20/M25/M40 family metallo-hydrolase [Gemmatimonadaceae bacterium]|nr:M20/M25/M40 family metallo-hydrolase [Gemmatimonadaceae bacterium]
MLRNTLVTLLVAMLSLAPTAPAQTSGPVRVTLGQVRRLESALADDSMEGRLTGSPGGARAARYIAAQMRSLGLRALGDSGYYQRVPVSVTDSGIDLRATFTDSAQGQHETGVNVIGLLKGSDPKLNGEIILVDAHYDHLGIGRAVNGDSIYNGADDDASGTVTVLAIARALSTGPRPRRSILFVLSTGEEEGLLGTRWLIAHFPVSLDSVKANLEIEMIGRPDSLAGGAGRAWLTGYDRSTMGDILRRAHVPIIADPRPAQHFFERSDNIAFAERGIPAHTLSSFGLHGDYHQPSDDLAHIDFAHLTSVINAAVRAVQLLANGPLPVWNPGGQPAAESR